MGKKLNIIADVCILAGMILAVVADIKRQKRKWVRAR